MNLRIAIIILPVAAVIVGCAAKDQEPHFVAARGDNYSARMFDAQIANGARDDATLHEAHFTAGGLSSLGQEKVRLMAGALAPGQAFTAYLNLDPAGPLFVQRSEAVAEAFAAAGFDAEQLLRIEPGVNPATLHPSADGIAALQRAREAQVSTQAQDTAVLGAIEEITGGGGETH